MLEVYALQVPNEMSLQTFSKLLSYVSVDKQLRIKRFNTKKDAYRTLLADILIRLIISDKYELPFQEITFMYNSHGKPFLSLDRGLSFNISHSGKWVVAIVGKRHLVGIDIEEIRPIEMEVARRFFAPEEYSDLKEKDERERLLFFYDLWTLKESYVKAIGRGLTIPLDSFVIQRKDLFGQFVIRQKHSPHNFFFQQYDIDKEYKLSACATTDTFPESISILNISEMYNRLL
ncbi:4'-phosphopantetheinyl transferase family protein [Brevibacillus sp. SYSU BS000544]|uniref:4'-phosphopantetheinyl transferase family protein n=1 Tax=Brevibacillus sp. SYSU BS000544 TaxID=3416443 RepID=UPI003CE48801